MVTCCPTLKHFLELNFSRPRWEGLKRDCEEKHDKVERTRDFYSWLLDVGEEQAWINEKIKSLNLDGTRDNLPAVNRLLKKWVVAN